MKLTHYLDQLHSGLLLNYEPYCSSIFPIQMSFSVSI